MSDDDLERWLRGDLAPTAPAAGPEQPAPAAEGGAAGRATGPLDPPGRPVPGPAGAGGPVGVGPAGVGPEPAAELAQASTWRPDLDAVEAEEARRRRRRLVTTGAAAAAVGLMFVWALGDGVGPVPPVAGTPGAGSPADGPTAGASGPDQVAVGEGSGSVGAPAGAEEADLVAGAAGAADSEGLAGAAEEGSPAVDGAVSGANAWTSGSAPFGDIPADDAPASAVGGGIAPADAGLAAAAAVHVRLSVGAEAAPDGRQLYVDLALPEGVERHTGGTAVVTVTAVLLEGTDGRWSAVRPARYAVALRDLPEGPQAIGAPWPLPRVADPSPVAQGQSAPGPVPSDLAPSAVAALEGSGYRDVQLEGVVDGAPPPLVIVRATAIAPGEDGPRPHEVWIDPRAPARVLGGPTPET